MFQSYSGLTLSNVALQMLPNNTGDAHSDAALMLPEAYGP